MVEVANRAGGMEQVFHDNTLIGNGNSVDLGVNTDIIATKEYVDEKVESIDTYTKDQIDGKLTAVDAQIDANADAIQKTREDYIQADSEIHQILNNHAENLTTLHNDVDDLGDQVAEIESKIPESASSTNPLVTKGDLADIDLDGYVKKSGDTMTGNLSFDIVDDKYKNIVWNPESEVWADDITVETRKYLVGPKIVSTGFDILQQYPTYQNASVVLGGVSVESDRFYPARSDGVMKLGLPNRRWDNVYTTNINNGNDLIVPAEGGTLARIEDLIDLRADINEADSELQTQITAQAAEIATKQDQLIAGDNIIISGNIISATGAGGGAGFDIVVVQELPATGQKGIIYLLAKDGAAPDVYDEYVWITATQTFELIGSTKVDLTDYAKKEYVDNAIAEFESFPDQTGNAGKFLKTDGAKTSWGKALENLATKSSSIISGTNSLYGFSQTRTVAIGNSINGLGAGETTAIGYNIKVNGQWRNVVFGNDNESWGNDNVVVGVRNTVPSSSSGGNILLGNNITLDGTTSNVGVINLSGSDVSITGSNSLFVVNANGIFEIMSADGTIPAERIGNLDFGTME